MNIVVSRRTPAWLIELCRRQFTDATCLAKWLAPIQDLPHSFFAPDYVCVSQTELSHMTAIVAAAQRVLNHCSGIAWGEQIMPEIASCQLGPRGVFFGYDFHLTTDGPKLIEINTNAGGVFLAAALAASQRWQDNHAQPYFVPPIEADDLPHKWVQMFKQEWQLQRGQAPLERIAIVDDQPREQFFYPEFLLFADLFYKYDLPCSIVNAAELDYDRTRRCLVDAQGQAQPMLYNRLTDFYLKAPEHAAIRQAYLAGDVVLTPHPRAYAQYADKRNLVLLSNQALLQQQGVADADVQTLLRGVPETILLTSHNASQLWRQRRQWFFKPVSSYGGKAAYRGENLTQSKWQEILASPIDYVAQRLAPPRTRPVERNGKMLDYKFDLRLVVYGDQVQLLAARLFYGQTANFRAPGSGLAPVVVFNDQALNL